LTIFAGCPWCEVGEACIHVGHTGIEIRLAVVRRAVRRAEFDRRRALDVPFMIQPGLIAPAVVKYA